MEERSDGGWSEVSTGVEADYAQPVTLARQVLLHQVGQVGALLHELGERHQAGRDRLGLITFSIRVREPFLLFIPSSRFHAGRNPTVCSLRGSEAEAAPLGLEVLGAGVRTLSVAGLAVYREDGNVVETVEHLGQVGLKYSKI